MSRLAFGRVESGVGGTTFAIDHTILITCWHCLTGGGTRRLVEDPITVRLAPDAFLTATYVDHDPVLDIAVLAVDEAMSWPAGRHPVSLGVQAPLAAGGAVRLAGWPQTNPAENEPQTVPAAIETPRTSIHDGHPVMQLYAPQIAAGLRPRGFSGGPVLADLPAGPTAIAVVRWMQPDDADPSRAVGGTVYATSVGDVVRRWPRLAGAVDPVEVLAGGPGAPGRRKIAEFIGAHLGAERRRLPFAGRDAELAALDATAAFSTGTGVIHEYRHAV